MKYEMKLGSLRAEADTHGGELVSFCDGGGTEYIWNGDPAYWTGRNPVLFPVVGNLKNGRVVINGKEYEMARHGFARGSEFELDDRGEDYVVFRLTENEETLMKYPFPFCLKVEHRLLENGFSTAFTVENTGKEPLVFCIGAHTAFRCPLREGEVFEDYELVFDEKETASTLLLNGQGLVADGASEPMLSDTDRLPLDYDVFARLDTIIFRGLESAGVSLRHKESGHGVRMDISRFPMVAFWTKGKERAPYVCLEPWQGCAAYEHESGIFEDKPHALTLEPGASKTLSYAVTIL